MTRCPTCGQATLGSTARPVRHRIIKCRWCGRSVLQVARGRPWRTCRAAECLARQKTYRRQGFVALERLQEL